MQSGKNTVSNIASTPTSKRPPPWPGPSDKENKENRNGGELVGKSNGAPQEMWVPVLGVQQAGA